MTVKVGLTFRHDYFLDPDWVPGSGQRYADAPKAAMIVTHVAGGRVWYGYDQTVTKGNWVMDLTKFTEQYVLPSQPKDPPSDGLVKATGARAPNGTPPDPAVSLPLDRSHPDAR